MQHMQMQEEEKLNWMHTEVLSFQILTRGHRFIKESIKNLDPILQ